jgi:hypothetical protein
VSWPRELSLRRRTVPKPPAIDLRRIPRPKPPRRPGWGTALLIGLVGYLVVGLTFPPHWR